MEYCVPLKRSFESNFMTSSVNTNSFFTRKEDMERGILAVTDDAYTECGQKPKNN